MSRLAQSSVSPHFGPNGKGDETDSSSSEGGNATHRPATRQYVRQKLGKWAELQAKGIRFEFARHRKEVDARFDTVDARFDAVDARFDTVDARFDAVDARFDAVDARFATLEDGQSILAAKQSNQMAYRLRSRVNLVGHVSRRSLSFSLPPREAPRWIGQFWALKEPRNHWKLIKLHQFYETEDWQTWGLGLESDDEDSGEDIVPKHKTLEEAVTRAPDEALSDLALQLGLNYTQISIYVPEDIRSRETREVSTLLSKRSSHGTGRSEPQNKRTRPLGKRTSPLLQTEVFEVARPMTLSPTEANTEDDTVFRPSLFPLTRSILVGTLDGEGKQRASPAISEHTRLGWKPPSDTYKAGRNSERSTDVTSSSGGQRTRSLVDV